MSGNSTESYDYKVVVQLGKDGKERRGRLWLEVTVKPKVGEQYKHKIKLTPHPSLLKSGAGLIFTVAAPFPFEEIHSAVLKWNLSSWRSFPFSRCQKLLVNEVTIVTAYLAEADAKELSIILPRVRYN